MQTEGHDSLHFLVKLTNSEILDINKEQRKRMSSKYGVISLRI